MNTRWLAGAVAVLCLVVAAETGGYVRQQNILNHLDRTTSRLGVTDRIACQFILADASARRQRIENSREFQLRKANIFLGTSGRLVGLFDKAVAKLQANKKTSAAQLSGLVLFRNYIVASRSVVSGQVTTIRRNIVVSSALAVKAEALAATLGCGGDPTEQ